LLLLAVLDGCAEPKEPCVYGCEPSDEAANSGSHGTHTGEPGPNDRDGDGWTPDEGDCNDNDAGVYPEAPEDACDGVDSNCDGVVEAAMVGGLPYDDLQDAIDGCPSGGKVLVCPGIHYGGFHVSDDLTLEGYTDDPKASVLDGADRDNVIKFTQWNLTLRSLTIQNGRSRYDGGGLEAHSVASLLIDDVVFRDNRAYHGGGGLSVHLIPFAYPDGAGPNDVTIRNSVFAGNTAGYSAGGAQLGSIWEPITVHIEDTIFSKNSSGFEGGAVELSASDRAGVFTFTRTSFDGNTAPGQGGAVHYGAWNIGTVTLKDCHATKNEALYGAAYYFSSERDSFRGNVLIEGGRITENGTINGTYGALYANKWWEAEVSNVDFGWGSSDNHNDVSGCDTFDSTASFFYSPGADVWCE
jgi:predicted outer membrane repeat protein